MPVNVNEKILSFCVFCGLATLGIAAPSAPAPTTSPASKPVRYAPGRRIATLADKRIDESSGLAASRRHEGVFWTHNDSGDRPRIFAFNRKGKTLAAITIKGASAIDWEDMAGFEMDGKAYLLLGDIGDNARKRKKCTLYLVEEPELDPAAGNITGSASVVRTINFTYEDGPHDCESVAVDPTSRTIYLITKRGLVRNVYELPIPKGNTGKIHVLRKIATLLISHPTAMDISPDGLRAVVLTYGNALQYTRRPGETWRQAFSRQPTTIRVPPRRQGEAICFARDGGGLFLTSEQLPAPLLEVPVAQKP